MACSFRPQFRARYSERDILARWPRNRAKLSRCINGRYLYDNTKNSGRERAVCDFLRF